MPLTSFAPWLGRALKLAFMSQAPTLAQPYSDREERWHIATHLVGLVGAAAAIPWLLLVGARESGGWRLGGAIVFSAAALLMFAASVLYHRSTGAEARQRWRTLDHAAIFLLIAGTYTPFAAGAIGGRWGFGLLIVVWSIAVFGIIAKVMLGFRYPRLSTLLYLAMGWAGIVAIKPMMEAISGPIMAWIAAGGLLYTLGVPFYVWKKRAYTHAVWHFFVLGGVACHFVAVLLLLRSA